MKSTPSVQMKDLESMLYGSVSWRVLFDSVCIVETKALVGYESFSGE